MLHLRSCLLALCVLRAASLNGTGLPGNGDTARDEAEVWELLGNDSRPDTAEPSDPGHPPAPGPSPPELTVTAEPSPHNKPGAAGSSHILQPDIGGILPTEPSELDGILPTEQPEGILPNEKPGPEGLLPNEPSETGNLVPNEQLVGILPTKQPGPHDILPTEPLGKVGPLPNKQMGTARPLPIKQPGTVGPLPTEPSGPEDLLPNDQPATAEPLPNDQPGTVGPLPIEQPGTAGPLPIEQPGTAGPLPTEQPGTVDPLLIEQPGTEDPLPIEQPGTADPLPIEQPGTSNPLPVEQPGTTGPLPIEQPSTTGPFIFEQPGTAGPLPNVQPGTAEPLPIEQPGTTGPLPIDQLATAEPLPTEQPGTAEPLPIEKPGTAEPSPVEQPGTGDPLLTEQLNTAETLTTEQPSTASHSQTEQPSISYSAPITVTASLTTELSPSEVEVTASELPILERDDKSSDAGHTRSIPVLTISVSSLCVCDLLVAQCDVNCCCDPDCSAADVSVFSECSVSVVTGDSQLCQQEAVLYSINSTNIPQRVIESVELVNPNVFCIQNTNYPPALSFIMPGEPTEANFDSLLREFGANQFNLENSALNAVGSAKARNATRYEYGTPILTPDSYLMLPAPMATTSCTDTNPIGFLSAQDFTCTRSIQLENCSVPALTLETYTSVHILPVPNSQQGINVTVQAVIMQSIDGALVRGSFSNNTPLYNSTTGICTNVVLGGSYTIYYSDQGRITRIWASFTLGTINSNTIQQSFQIRFIEEGTAPASLSGNPGYVFGMPLRAGFKLPQSGIIQSTNRFGQLTMLKSSSDQSCLSGEGKRAAVLFGHNMMSGCKLRLNYTGSDFCQLAAEATMNALKGQQFPEYVAQFGNSQQENVLDWVAINAISPEEQASIKDMCKVPVSLELEVRWTKFGSLVNPQAQIVKVTEKITHAFFPINLNSMRTVAISTAVTFSDVSAAASPGYKAQPTIDAKLPFDFFHPFV